MSLFPKSLHFILITGLLMGSLIAQKKRKMEGTFFNEKKQKHTFNYQLLFNENIVARGCDADFEFKYLEPGSYTLKVWNWYQDTFSHTIILGNKHVKDLEIQVMEFDYEKTRNDFPDSSSIPPAQSLNVGDSLVYYYYSYGCFHYAYFQIFLYRKPEGVYALYSKEKFVEKKIGSSDSVTYVLVPDPNPIEHKLTESEFGLFIQFEKEFWRVYQILKAKDRLESGCRGSTTVTTWAFQNKGTGLMLCAHAPSMPNFSRFVESVFQRDIYNSHQP